MMHFQDPHFSRDDDFIDCESTEAYPLEDILHEVRELDGVVDASSFSFSSDYDVLVWAFSLLSESPLARSFAFDARFEDWAIELDECEDGRHIVDSQLRVLILPRFVPSAAALGRSPYFRHTFLAELCRGLRSIWHQSTHVRHGHDLTIPQRLLWERLVQADQDLMTLLTAWELREADLPELWRHMIGSDLGDIAVAFSSMLERHPEGVETAHLLRAMFLQWMEHDDYVSTVDHRMLEWFDDCMNTPGSGRAYGTSRLTGGDVICLTAIPEDSSYLEPMATLVLSDDFFSRRPDVINQAHLDQILRDIAAQHMTLTGFRDQDLARRIFPDLPERQKIDTIA